MCSSLTSHTDTHTKSNNRSVRFQTSFFYSASVQRSQGSSSKSTFLPRPLTSTDLTALPSEGSRLMRVAYQGSYTQRLFTDTLTLRRSSPKWCSSSSSHYCNCQQTPSPSRKDKHVEKTGMPVATAAALVAGLCVEILEVTRTQRTHFIARKGSKAVAYVNVDCAVQGRCFPAAKRPQLHDILIKVTNKLPKCIEKLAHAGIKIWVLTYHKMETAINIGFACSLLRQGMTQIIITSNSPEIVSAEKAGDKNLKWAAKTKG